MTVSVEMIVGATAGTLLLAIVTVAIFQRNARFKREVVSAADPGVRHRSRIVVQIDERVLRTRWGKRLAASLAGAGLARWSPSASVLMAVIAAAVAGAIGYGLLGWVFALVAAVGVITVAFQWLAKLRQARVDRFVSQLPELARLLSNSAEAGLSVHRGLELAATEMADPAQTELRQVVSELSVGRTLQGALENLNVRLPSSELAVLMQTIVIQARAGGALVKALSGISATLEERQQLRREIRTATSGATFTGFLVMGIGIGAVLLMNLIQPGVLDDLVSHPIGFIVVCVAFGFFVVGFLAMRRMGKVHL